MSHGRSKQLGRTHRDLTKAPSVSSDKSHGWPTSWRPRRSAPCTLRTALRYISLAASHAARLSFLVSSSPSVIPSNSSSSFASSPAIRPSLEPKEPSGATEQEAKPEIASRRLPEGCARRRANRQRNALGEARPGGAARASIPILANNRHRGLIGVGTLDVVDGTERREMDRSKATCPTGATEGEHQM